MPEIELVNEPPRHFVGVRRTLNVKTDDIPAFFAEALPKTFHWLQSRGIAPASPPMAMWLMADQESGICEAHAGMFVSNAVAGDDEITAGTTAGGELLKAIHVGGYDTVGKTWMTLYAHARELGRAPGAGWEVYVDDPQEVAAEELRTEIHLPLQPR